MFGDATASIKEKIFSDEATSIKELRLSLDPPQVLKKETVLNFIRENVNLREVTIHHKSEDGLSESQRKSASSLTEAVRYNHNITALRLDLYLDENCIGKAYRAVKVFSGSLTNVQIHFPHREDSLLNLETEETHIALAKLGREIALQKELTCLYIDQVRAVAFSSMMSGFTTCGNWEKLRKLEIADAGGYGFPRLEAFVSSCAQNLRELRIITSQNLGTHETKELVSALEKSSNLHSLDVIANGMGRAGMRSMAEYIASAHCTLQSLGLDLELNHDCILEKFHNILVPALASNASIKEMAFGLNCTGSLFSVILRDLLKPNRTMTVLEISWEGGEGFHEFCPLALVHGLCVNSTLKILHLRGAPEELNTSSLGEALQLPTSLEELTLSEFHLQEHPEANISSFVDKLPSTLRSLSIDCDSMEHDGQLFVDIFRSIQTKTALQRLHLGAMSEAAVTTFLNCAAEVLPSTSHLTHLSFCIDIIADGQSNAYIRDNQQVLLRFLHALERNFSLVSLHMTSPVECWFDEAFDSKFQRICVRNRVHKIAQAIGNAEMTTSIVPSALDSIDKICKQYKVDPVLQQRYISSLVHSVLKRSPGTPTVEAIFAYLRQSVAAKGGREVRSKRCRQELSSALRKRGCTANEGSNV